MWRLVCVAFVTISLVVGFGATAYAQALAPSALNLASHDQKSADDMVQVITEKSARETTGKPAPAIAKDSARTFAMEPVRPMNQPTVSKKEQPVSRFTFKTAGGIKESAPVITQYYPKQMVYPFGRVDRHIDSRLMQAASIAQERAHAHSRSRCWHYVKEALL